VLACRLRLGECDRLAPTEPEPGAPTPACEGCAEGRNRPACGDGERERRDDELRREVGREGDAEPCPCECG